jgi:hypothetical protein
MPSRRNCDARRRRHRRHQPKASVRLSLGTPTPNELPEEPRPHEPDRCAAWTSPPTTNFGIDHVGHGTSYRGRCTTPKQQQRRCSGAAAPASQPLTLENSGSTSPTHMQPNAPPRQPSATDLGERPRSPHTAAHRSRGDAEDRPGSGSPATRRARPTGRARSGAIGTRPTVPAMDTPTSPDVEATDWSRRPDNRPPDTLRRKQLEHQPWCCPSSQHDRTPCRRDPGPPPRRPAPPPAVCRPRRRAAAARDPRAGGGGPAAGGYRAGFARRRRPTAARRTEEGRGELWRLWARPCRPPGSDADAVADVNKTTILNM